MARSLPPAAALLLLCACARSPSAPAQAALFTSSWDQVLLGAIPGPQAGFALDSLAHELSGPSAPPRFARLPPGSAELFVLTLEERDLRVPGAPPGEARTVCVGASLRDTIAQRTVFVHLVDPLTTSQPLLDRLASQKLLAHATPKPAVVRRQLVLGGEPMAEQPDDARLALDVEAHSQSTTVLVSLLAPGSARERTLATGLPALATGLPALPDALALADLGRDVRFLPRPGASLRLAERSATTSYAPTGSRIEVQIKTQNPRVQPLFTDAATQWSELTYSRRTVRLSLPSLDSP